MNKRYIDDYPEILAILDKYAPNYFDEFGRIELYKRNPKKRGGYSSENPSYLSALFYNLLKRISPIDAQKYSDYYSHFLLDRCSISKGDMYLNIQRQPFGSNTYPADHPDYVEERNWNDNSKDEMIGIFSIGTSLLTDLLLRTGNKTGWIFNDYPKESLYEGKPHPLQNQYYYLKSQDEKTSVMQKAGHYIDRAYDKVMRHFFASGVRVNDKGKLIEKLRRPVADSIIKDFMKWGETEHLVWAVNYYIKDESHPFKILVRQL
jgi:hypothetical protein